MKTTLAALSSEPQECTCVDMEKIKKTEQIHIRVTEKQKAKWAHRAKMYGYKSLSEMIVRQIEDGPIISRTGKPYRVRVGMIKE